jgi:hypothetical protein
MRLYSLFFILVGVPFVVLGQGDSAAIIKPNEYITDKSNFINISVFNRNPNNLINLESKFNLTFKPNDVFNQGIKIQHKWFGLGIGFSPKKLQDDKRGSTDELDLHLYVYSKRQYLDAYFISYKGFYLENFKQNDTLKKYYNSFPLMPDLSIITTGLTYLHLFNHQKFSLRASFTQNEIQRKSAGSFVLGSSLNYMRMENSGNIIPKELRSIALADQQFVQVSFYDISILPGYAHTFVYKRFYLTLVPMLGVALQYQNFSTVDERNPTRVSNGFRSLSKVSIGYNSDRFFCALTGTNDTYNYVLIPEVRLRTQISEARVIIGYRFNTTGFIQKISNQMDKIIKP